MFRVWGLGFRVIDGNVGPGLVGASSIKSIWLGYSGHPDCLGVRGGILNKGSSPGRRKKIPLRGIYAPFNRI